MQPPKKLRRRPRRRKGAEKPRREVGVGLVGARISAGFRMMHYYEEQGRRD